MTECVCKAVHGQLVADPTKCPASAHHWPDDACDGCISARKIIKGLLEQIDENESPGSSHWYDDATDWLNGIADQSGESR